MAVPKRRHSATRGRKRRTHWKLKATSTQPCDRCNSPKLPHRVCANCGYYDGEEIVTPRED